MSGDPNLRRVEPRKTHYTTLVTPPRYKTLALQWHPDKQEPGASDQMFKQSTEAYSILSDDIFGEFFHMRGRAPFPFQRAARPHPVSKQIICDLTTDENGRYYVQVHWSDGSITYERL
ncbi:hypothetical protein MDAP_000722 [Mitosporidium daphniae]|uniref:Molecular chaperone n=1 Tax=Mitosporidium daphniae TaxID=1485682 RepID=A0A098VSR1_9MICR|nr:molecular chaperone [Mitosporidium daphniae]KGG50756.1 molecular chaperone [Mitosporidium daphniae]|eukprot:XP_013237183.1 molecular chaperone [Mitosporidium daphniae]